MMRVNVYIKNIPSVATLQEILDFMGVFGKIQSSKFYREERQVPENEEGEEKENEEAQECNGFGFVCYTNADEAFRALKDGPDTEFKGKKMFFSRWEPKEIREAHLQETLDQRQL